MNAQGESQRLFARWRQGDEEAAAAIFDRYAGRLVALARSRMASHLRVREDEEDVVQSVYRTFFSRARAGQFLCERTGDLWRLLAAMTFRKARNAVKFHLRDRRDSRRDEPLLPDTDVADADAVQPAESDLELLVGCLEEAIALSPGA